MTGGAMNTTFHQKRKPTAAIAKSAILKNFSTFAFSKTAWNRIMTNNRRMVQEEKITPVDLKYRYSDNHR